jgi:outer membrane immunogenic protein
MNSSLRRQGLLAPVGTVLVMMLAVASANAADAPIPYGAPPPQYAPPPYAPPPYAPQPPVPCLWLGPYVGTNVGFQWTSNIGGLSSSGFTGGMSGFTGGIQGGYNWQSGPWVYGVESDFNLSSASGTFAGYQFSNPWFGTLRGRAGYAINNVFLYGTAGLAFGISTVARDGLSDSSGHMGWTIGAGAEFGLAPLGLSPNWSAKVEYLYLGLSQGGAILPASVPSNFQSNVLRFGVNYHF